MKCGKFSVGPMKYIYVCMYILHNLQNELEVSNTD